MVTTINALTSKINTLLSTAYTGTKTKVHSAFYLPIESDSLPAIVVYPKSDKLIEDFEDDTQHRSANFIVEIRAIGLPPITILQPYMDKIIKTLFTDSTLGGSATYVTLVSQTFDGAVLDKEYCAAAIELEIGYIFSPIAQG